MAAAILFWLSAGLLAYVYVGFPRLIALIGRLRAWKPRRESVQPSVTVVVAAYNEEAGITEKLSNILALDYPAGQLQILVASDASSDKTDEIVMNYPAANVRLHRVEGRVGKTACQNDAVKVSSGEIVLFTDATTRLDPQCLRYMMENFADPQVGCVAGALCYVAATDGGVAHGSTTYWDYELDLRRSESVAGGLIGVSGCLYAVKRCAYVPIRPDLISDFCIAMRMQEQGLRTVLDDRAVCYEDTLHHAPLELSMRVRVAVRSIRAMLSEMALLNPWRHGLFAIKLISHKFLRYLSPFIWLLALITNALLLPQPFYVATLLGQLAILLAGALGFLVPQLQTKWRLFTKPSYFLLTNVASLLAFFKVMRGERMVTWKPIR